MILKHQNIPHLSQNQNALTHIFVFLLKPPTPTPPSLSPLFAIPRNYTTIPILDKIDDYLKVLFLELACYELIQEKVMAALFWRDVRLQSIEDFLIILDSMDGLDVFVDFEIVMRKLTGLSSSNLLESRHAE